MTNEGKRLILEWCGWLVDRGNGVHYYQQRKKWRTPDDIWQLKEPALDINFYFKYVVPKLRYISLHYDSKLNYLVCLDGGENTGLSTAEGEDPAEAFGQALIQLIKGE